jgi:ABC-type multidrug transport system ATPase subunit
MITDRVGILNKGKLLREGSVKELTEKKEEYKIRLDNDSADLTKFASAETSIYKNSDGTFTIKVDNVSSLNKLIDKIRNESILVQEIILQKSTLEEMFISVINEAEGADKK